MARDEDLESPSAIDGAPSGAMRLDGTLEANHRVANNLATILILAGRLASRLEAGPDTIQRTDAVMAIRELASNVAAIMTLHRLLAAHAGADAVDLAQLLGGTLRTLGDVHGERLRASLHVRDDPAVTGDQAGLMMIALAEIVANAMKYAHPTGLPVGLSVVAGATADGRIFLECADDGIGLPEGFDPARDAGVGLGLLDRMARAAGGELAMTSDALGLTVVLSLPDRQA